MSDRLTELLAGYELAARSRMDQVNFDYFYGGAGDETSLEESVVAWRRHRFRPHVLRDVSSRDLTTEVLGARLAMPVMIAPTAYHQVAHPDGEVETARGARAAGALLTLSTRSTMKLESVAEVLGDAPWWFQVYVVHDRRVTEAIVRRVAALGPSALVLTGDTPFLAQRRRGGLPAIGFEGHLVNFGDHIEPGTPVVDVFAGLQQDDSITLDTVAWLHDLTGLPVLVKGVLRGDDASACIDAGAAGLIVSNHGGRQLDRAVAAATALPEVVAAAAGRVPVLVDGGIRSGADVLVALALGAGAVMVGRPVLWGLAAEGAAGVRRVLECYRDELDHAMGLAGVTSIAGIDASLLWRDST